MSRPEAAAGARPAWDRAVLAHGVLLLLFFLCLRVEKAVELAAQPVGTIGWLRFVVPDVALVLLFEAVWLLWGPARWRWPVLAAAHLVLALLVAVAHSFLLATGYRLEIVLTVYAVRHLGMLREIFSVVADAPVVARVVGAAACALLPLPLYRRRGGTAVARRWALAALAAGVAGTALLPAPRGMWLAANDAWAFLASARGLLRERLASRYIVPPADFYAAPVLRGEAARLPNLLLVLLESTGAGDVAPWAPGAPTPALERLAREGLRVESAYASVSHTSKALIGILCGVMPRLEMEIVEAFEGNLTIPCLPRLLGDLGYRTVFLQTALSRFENRPGLVRNLGFAEAAYRETLDRPPFERVGYFGLDDFAMLEPAAGWIEAAGGAPWFMTLLTSAPHHPYQTPGVPMAEARAAPEAAHRRAIADQDRFLAELIARLEASGALADTVVVVLGDHGEAFGEHHRQQHDAVPYEEVMRVPWVLYGPAWLGPPRVVTGLRHHADLLPTVLALAGAEWEGVLPGRDLLATDGHDLVFSSCWYTDTCVAARIGDTKVIYHFGRRPLEVFDLGRDPLERRDLEAALPAATVREVEERLLGYKLSVDRFWEQFPARRGPETWWLEGAAGVEAVEP